MAVFLSLILLGGYSYLIFRFSKEWFSVFNKQRTLVQIAVFIAMLVPGVVLFFLLKNEHFIYYWDFSGYWVKATRFVELFFKNPFAGLEKMYSSINYMEYNYFPNLLLAFLNQLLGLKFEDYVFSVYLVYALPVALVVSSFIIKATNGVSDAVKLVLPFFCLLFTPFLIPIRYGFVDIIGLLPVFMILSLLLKTDYLRKKNIKVSIFIGFLILVLVFTRRWYAFWAVSFYAGVLLVNLVYSIKMKNKLVLRNTMLNLFVTGVVPLALMLLFFYPFFEMTVLKDYGEIYTAYNRAPFSSEVETFIDFFGIILLLFCAAGGVFLFFKNKSLLAFLFVSTAVIIVLFAQVNDFGGYQHYYLLMPFLAVLLFQGAVVASKKTALAFPLLFVVLVAGNLKAFVFPGVNSGNFFSSVNAAPKFRSDYFKILEIADDVERLTRQGNYVYCLASSGTLNNSILKNTQLPETKPFPRFLPVQHVDKRDHFPNELFRANYVIVTKPLQIHLRKTDQMLIAYFNHAIVEGNLKNNYHKVKSYPLQNGTTAYLMKKTRGLNEKEIAVIKNDFKQAYPDFKNMYAVNPIILKTSKIIAGDSYGKVVFKNNTIYFNPGSSRPSEIWFGLNDSLDYEISFTAALDRKKQIIKNCNPAKDGEVFTTILADDEMIKKLYITHKKDISINMRIENADSVGLIISKGKNKDYCDWFKLTGFSLQPAKE